MKSMVKEKNNLKDRSRMLHPKNIDSKDVKQVQACIKETIMYADLLKGNFSGSPFLKTLTQRTHKESRQKVF